MDEPIKILILDDQTIVRTGMKLLLESREDITVVGDTGSCVDAIAIAKRKQPDIILTELLKEEDESLSYISDLAELSGQSRVIVVTSISDNELHYRAIQLGAMGLVLKSKDPQVLFKAIEKVQLGEAWLDRSTIAKVLSRRVRPLNDNKVSESSKIGNLTRRERDIITLVAQGLKNKQIAGHLSISDITVRHHLTSVFNKLEVADRFELIIYAYKNGICDIPG
jgi:DNA-binding NarL/FixJ family response regulator